MDSIRIRASSLPSLFDCSMRWEAENIKGIRKPGNAYTQIGTAVHASTAAFDREEGDVSETADIAVDELHDPSEEVDWQGVGMDFAVEAAVTAHVNYCDHIASEFNYELIEHTLENVFVDMGDGITFELTGTLDRIYRNDQGELGVADIKTGKAIVSPHGEISAAKHLPQLGEYELLAEQEVGILDAPAVVIGLQTSGGYRYGTAPVDGAKEALIGDEFAPGMLHYAANMFRTGLFPPNPSSFLCSDTYCPIYERCKYHG